MSRDDKLPNLELILMPSGTIGVGAHGAGHGGAARLSLPRPRVSNDSGGWASLVQETNFLRTL
jgi:hypothetical protein